MFCKKINQDLTCLPAPSVLCWPARGEAHGQPWDFKVLTQVWLWMQKVLRIKLLLRRLAHFYPSSYPGRSVSRNIRRLPPESALFNNLEKNNSWGWGCISAKNTGRTDRNIFCLLRVVISHSPHVPLCVNSVLKRTFYTYYIHRSVCGILSLLSRMSSTIVTRLPGRREQRLQNVHRPQCGPTVQARGILRCCLRFQSKFLSKYGIWDL